MLELLHGSTCLDTFILEQPEPPKSVKPFVAKRDIPDWKIDSMAKTVQQKANAIGGKPQIRDYLNLAAEFKLLFPERSDEVTEERHFQPMTRDLLAHIFTPSKADRHEQKLFLARNLLQHAIVFPEQYQSLSGSISWEDSVWNNLLEIRSILNSNLDYSHLLATMHLLFPDRFDQSQFRMANWNSIVHRNYPFNNASQPEGLWLQSNLKLAFPDRSPFGMSKAVLNERIAKEVASWQSQWTTTSDPYLLDVAAICQVLVADKIRMTKDGLVLANNEELPHFDMPVPEIPKRRTF